MRLRTRTGKMFICLNDMSSCRLGAFAFDFVLIFPSDALQYCSFGFCVFFPVFLSFFSLSPYFNVSAYSKHISSLRYPLPLHLHRRFPPVLGSKFIIQNSTEPLLIKFKSIGDNEQNEQWAQRKRKIRTTRISSTVDRHFVKGRAIDQI